MPNMNQAPEIKYNGEKFRDQKKWGKAIRTHELETAIMCGLGDRDMAMLKIMLFLTGNAEGFGVAEKTICERCNISETGYKKARKKLIEKGWITLIESKQIIVNYDNIFKQGITEDTPTKPSEKSKGITENTPLGITENTPSGITEDTHNKITNNINDSINSFDEAGSSNSQATPEEEEKGSLNNPIPVSKEWVISHYNSLNALANNKFYDGNKFYQMRGE